MPVIEDIQQWSITAATNANADPGINWAEHMPRADVNNSARSVMAAVAKFRNLMNSSITTGGSANAQTFTSGVSYTSVPTGLRCCLKIGFTNTASPTLNMDGIGAVVIKDVYGNNLGAGVLKLNARAEFIYDGTNWILLGSPVQSIPGVTDGSSAAVGMVGEVATATATVSLNASVVTNIASFTLTAGDWDIWAGFYFVGGVVSSFVYGSISNVSGATNNAPQGIVGSYISPQGDATMTCGPVQNVSASPTTWYAVGYPLIYPIAGTARIFARRMH